MACQTRHSRIDRPAARVAVRKCVRRCLFHVKQMPRQVPRETDASAGYPLNRPRRRALSQKRALDYHYTIPSFKLSFKNMMFQGHFEVIVVGGGRAGTEAAVA